MKFVNKGTDTVVIPGIYTKHVKRYYTCQITISTSNKLKFHSERFRGISSNFVYILDIKPLNGLVHNHFHFIHNSTHQGRMQEVEIVFSAKKFELLLLRNSVPHDTGKIQSKVYFPVG